MAVSIDSFYRNQMRQVFFYITHNCNYSCSHCLVGDRSKASAYSYTETPDILARVQQLGATKVTLLGGEPTTHRDLLDILGLCKDLGFFVVLDTNGSFPIEMFEDDRFKKIDTLCFSVDGALAEMHDAVRGHGSFRSILDRIDIAQAVGIGVKFTHTVTGANLSSVMDMLELAEQMQIDELNFHIATYNGRAKHVRNPGIVSPGEWFVAYRKIKQYIESQTTTKTLLRIPPRYCTQDELTQLYSDHKCIGYVRDRMLILPQDETKGDIGGPLYVCGLLVGEKETIGWNTGTEFIFNHDGSGEYAKYYAKDLPYLHGIPICPIIARDNSNMNHLEDDELIPLCISYKPAIARKTA